MDSFVSIGRNMMIADKYFRMYLRDCLQPYDMNAAEGTVLLMMYRSTMNADTNISSNSGHTQDELIRELHYDKGVMTRTMKDLESKGYVERVTNPSDSRSFIFSLTSKGSEFRETLFGILKQWNSMLLDGISIDILSAAEKALEKMAKNASAFYSRQHSQK